MKSSTEEIMVTIQSGLTGYPAKPFISNVLSNIHFNILNGWISKTRYSNPGVYQIKYRLRSERYSAGYPENRKSGIRPNVKEGYLVSGFPTNLIAGLTRKKISHYLYFLASSLLS